MKTLIVEDDFVSRLLLQEFLKEYGPSHVAVNGKEAVEAVRIALNVGEPYHLICLDIMMPEMDGQEALRQIRRLEEEKEVFGARRARIIMTTALADRGNVIKAAEARCDHFLVKPIEKARLLTALRDLGLIQ
ncbi:MAG TPA: response regulator [Desulfobacteraceae bacterium]|nr:response regulator [Desulfobacteraceae bacterium]